MTYGAPRDDADVAAYLARVRGGRTPSDELVAEMTRRYRIIGGSPLIRITQEQAAALERELGSGYVVNAAMRYSEPSIETVAARIAPTVDDVVGLVLSPQWSDFLMSGYERALRDAAARAGLAVRCVAHAWYDEPLFIACLAGALRAELARLDRPAILLTAHSIPKRVYDAEPAYVEQLRATGELVASAARLRLGEWRFAYQSAGHTQEEWLRPDLVELFPEIAASGKRDILVIPVQFLADHLEILYDLDVAARAQAEAQGLTYHRIEMPNASPRFILALARVVSRAAAPPRTEAGTPRGR